MSSRGKPLNQAGLQKMARGLTPQLVSDDLTMLENEGWQILQQQDNSYVAVHAGKDLRTAEGQIFVRDNVVRAARYLESNQQQDDSTEHAWFREVEVLNDVYCRRISDLSESDLHKALLQDGSTSPDYGEALRLEIKLRKAQGIALPQYRRWRIQAATLTTVELIGHVKRAHQRQEAESPKLQALRDELNSRLRIVVDEHGVYAEDEESEIHQFDEPFVNARIVTRNTSAEVGWIYGYSWQRGSQFVRRPLTAGESFASREAALDRAVERVQQENTPDIEHAGPVQVEGAAKLFAWANSLLSGVMIVDSSSSQSHFDYDSLDAETRAYAQHATSKIRSLFRRTLEDVIAIGIELKEMKRRLKGQYSLWLEAEFPMSQRFARRCMGVVDAGLTPEGGFERVPISLIYELANESTPQEARQEIARRSQTGERITRDTVSRTIKQYQSVELKNSHQQSQTVSAKLAEISSTRVSANLAETESAAFNAGETVESVATLVTNQLIENPAALIAGQAIEAPAALNAGDDNGFFASLIKQQDVFLNYSFYKDAPDKIMVAVRFGNQHASASYLILSLAEFGDLPPLVRQLITEKQEALEALADNEVML